MNRLIFPLKPVKHAPSEEPLLWGETFEGELTIPIARPMRIIFSEDVIVESIVIAGDELLVAPISSRVFTEAAEHIYWPTLMRGALIKVKVARLIASVVFILREPSAP